MEQTQQLSADQLVAVFHVSALDMEQHGDVEQTGGVGPFLAIRAAGNWIALFAHRQRGKIG